MGNVLRRAGCVYNCGRASAMNRVIHTIGHSNHALEDFLRLLKGANVVCDVRSHPVSRRFPRFSRDALSASLKQAGLDYVWLGRELGGRVEECRAPDGRTDYRAAAQRPVFRRGIERVAQMAEDGLAPVLMCSERDPLTCHRALLVCRALRDEGMDIRHILADGRVETGAEMEERLMEMHGRPALPLATDDLERAYDWLAKKIAHRSPFPA